MAERLNNDFQFIEVGRKDPKKKLLRQRKKEFVEIYEPFKPAQAADQGTVAVRSGDTLSSIASRNLPSGVSLDQMLVALFRGNPDAFIGKNMNLLKAGEVLHIPSAQQASEVSSADAREVIANPDIDVVVELIGGIWRPNTLRIARISARSPTRVEVPWALM